MSAGWGFTLSFPSQPATNTRIEEEEEKEERDGIFPP